MEAIQSIPEVKFSIPEAKNSPPEVNFLIPEANKSIREVKISILEANKSIREVKISIPEAKNSPPELNFSILEAIQSTPMPSEGVQAPIARPEAAARCEVVGCEPLGRREIQGSRADPWWCGAVLSCTDHCYRT